MNPPQEIPQQQRLCPICDAPYVPTRITHQYRAPEPRETETAVLRLHTITYSGRCPNDHVVNDAITA
jgi:hypothetical protein